MPSPFSSFVYAYTEQVQDANLNLITNISK